MKKIFLYFLPVLFLIIYIAGLPFPVPAFLLRTVEYKVPDIPGIAVFLEQTAMALHSRSRIHLMLPHQPDAETVRIFESFQTETSIPLSFSHPGSDTRPLFLGISYRYSPSSTALPVTVLFSPEVRTFDRIIAAPGKGQAFSLPVSSLPGHNSLTIELEMDGNKNSLDIVLQGADVEERRISVTLRYPDYSDPRVLKVTRSPGRISVIDWL